ncbi:hypothetical protein ACHAQA_004335 [Verticillium albo-atrum]
MLAPSRSTRRARQVFLTVAAILLIYVFLLRADTSDEQESDLLRRHMNDDLPQHTLVKSSFNWSTVKFAHPPQPLVPPAAPFLPRRSTSLPRLQAHFPRETVGQPAYLLREARRQAVRQAFARDWAAYRTRAWGQDAVNPLSGTGKDQFSGWAATLVDSLDTLWIMGFRTEFDEAVAAVARIDFGTSTNNRVNMFETTIRYLGGLLAAYDLSGRAVLLAKAVELGDMLYAGFNTVNGMPVDFLNFERAKTGEGLIVEQWVVSASPGTLSLEMTRLSQITGDMKYYDAVTGLMRVFRDQQMSTRLPGLWPMWISMSSKDVHARSEFTFGGGADSLFEYLPKMHALLGGGDPMYGAMTKAFMKAAETLFFRPMVPDQADILISGNALVEDDGIVRTDPESEHLTCFIGGTFALAGRLLDLPAAVDTGVKLARGCAYVYGAFASGMMPERYNMVPCTTPLGEACPWDEALYVRECEKRPEYKPHLPKGFTTAKDPRYILRPEAIESVFVSYRITADAALQDTAWAMFEAVANGTAAEFGHASVKDVTVPPGELVREDYMESFWLAETLKYYYLVFSPPDLISLDEFVLNTEAHPLRMPA